MRIVTTILLGALFAALSTGAALAMGASLRVGTFNTQFLPPEAFIADQGTPNPYNFGRQGRAQLIADRILESDYDIFALNEVFDEFARAILVIQLRGTFPHFVGICKNWVLELRPTPGPPRVHAPISLCRRKEAV